GFFRPWPASPINNGLPASCAPMEEAHIRRLCLCAGERINGSETPSVRHDTVNQAEHGARLASAMQYRPVIFDCTVSGEAGHAIVAVLRAPRPAPGVPGARLFPPLPWPKEPCRRSRVRI